MSFSYSFETTTMLNGNALYRSGNRYLISGTFAYAWNDHWTTQLGASLSHYDKNRVLVGVIGLSPLATEAFNSNSNSYPVNLALTYAGENFSIGPTLSFLYRDKNAWSPTSFQFAPAKRSWGAGLKGQYAIRENVTLSASAERVWLTESSNPNKILAGVVIPGTGTPGYDTLSWRMSFGMTYGF